MDILKQGFSKTPPLLDKFPFRFSETLIFTLTEITRAFKILFSENHGKKFRQFKKATKI